MIFSRRDIQFGQVTSAPPSKPQKPSGFRRAPRAAFLLPTSPASPRTTWRRRLPRLAVVSMAIICLCAYLDYRSNPREMRPLDPFEQVAHSVRMGIYGAYHSEQIAAARSKIVLVTINDDTFSKLGGPPVPRRFHAQVLRDLTRAGAKVVGFDLLFKSPARTPLDDKEFVQAARQSSNALWACLFQGDEDDLLESDSLVPEPPLEPPLRALEALRKASPHEGHINSGAVVLDNPIIDRINPVIQYGGRLVPSFSFAAARMILGSEAPLEKVEGGWKSGSLMVPTDSEGNFLITFLRPSGYGVRDDVFPSVPYERIAQGGVDEEFFRAHKYFEGKIVLVGDSSKVGNDHSATPVGEMPGVEIHAHAITTILTGAYIHQAPALANLAAIGFMGGIVCLLAAARRLQVVMFGVLGVGIAFMLLNVWLFVMQGWWLHMVAPLATLALAAVGMLIEDGLFHESEREKMFEAFVTASASAIESRDPATSGHSKRVTDLCIALAKAVTDTHTGPLRKARFSQSQLRELRYAGLLHDFGKIGVRENVLTKSHKLPPDRFEAVQCRLALAHSQMMLRCAQEKLRVLQLTQVLAAQDTASHVERIEQKYAQELEQVKLDGEFLHRCNDPMVTFLPDPDYNRLQQVLSRLECLGYIDADGKQGFVITQEEKEALSIRKGSLTLEEYKEIQRHSQFSYDFLKQIPWTDSMSAVPDIAYGHHEKLNGTGYPRGIRADEIPLPVRIMTIADIFDALTAADRPYKKAMSIERALAILSEEAESGALDADLLQVFIEDKVYEKVDGASPTPEVGNRNSPAVGASVQPAPEPSRPKPPSTPAHRLA